MCLLVCGHMGSSEVAFSEVHSAEPEMVQALGNRRMQAYNERWHIGTLLRGMLSVRGRPRQC